MRDERKKEERTKQSQTNKAKQHSTSKAVTKKNELPRVGLKPTTLYTLDSMYGYLIVYTAEPLNLVTLCAM